MVFLSQVVGKPIIDGGGVTVGRVRDLTARIGDEPYPPVTGVAARQGRRDLLIGGDLVAEISDEALRLSVSEADLRPASRGQNEILLGRHVLDRQLIDVGGRRVIRVNDIQLAPAERGYAVVGVDVSPQAILGRLGLRRFAGRSASRSVLDWADVEYFATDAPALRLKPSHQRLSQLHPSDIAQIVDAVSYRQGAEILDSLDVETAADAMEELPPERQADLVRGMDEERAADIIERMAPDDATDLIADLEDEKARALLALMEDAASEDVEELLAYPADSAGGLMTPDFARVLPDMTVGEAIEHIRHLPFEPELIYYVYVVDSLDYDTPILLGVVSLRDMILAGLDRRMDELMVADIHAAAPDTPAEDVARVVGEYNLLALPVLDEGQILGIVTVDDVMETLLPGQWRERIPRLFR